MATANPAASAPYSFPISLAENLDDSNYLHWRPRVEPVIKSHLLHLFVASLRFLHNISLIKIMMLIV